MAKSLLYLKAVSNCFLGNIEIQISECHAKIKVLNKKLYRNAVSNDDSLWMEPTRSTLINFLSFAQLSLISKKMSALTLSLPFSKIECAPDHHSFKKSALVFQSFSFSNIQ